MKSLLRSHRLFLIVLLVLTAMLTGWLDRISTWQHEGRLPDPSQPEFTAETLTMSRFAKDGKLVERLTAARMWQYPGKADVFFNDPQLYQYKDGLLSMLLQAEVGRYNNDNKQAFFEKNVIMNQSGTNGYSDLRIQTRAMHVDTDKRVARSDEPTVIHYGGSQSYSMGFVYQEPVGQLTLLSKTKLVYAP